MSDTLKFRLTLPNDLPLAKYLSTLTHSAMRHELIRLASNGLAWEGGSGNMARPVMISDPELSASTDDRETRGEQSNAEPIAAHDAGAKLDTRENVDEPLMVDFGSDLTDYIG